MWDTLQMPLAGWVLASVAVTLAWLRQRRTANAGVVDVVWSASIGLLAVAYALLADGWIGRRLLVAALAGGWSLRLTWHLARRVAREPEDGRYQALRARLGAGADRWFFWFFQAQAALAVLLSLPFLLLAEARPEGWRAQDFAAIALWVVALVGEGVADRQLNRWRAEPTNAGRTCRAGLWRYSRHPNYFFEWLHWLSYPLLGAGLAFGWTLWLAPTLMLFLVLRVTGIPPTEERALESRGEDYRAYQRTTNAFFPGPTRPDASTCPAPRPAQPTR